MSIALEIKKEEALKRMRLLDLHENVINEFDKEGKLNLSANAALFWLENHEKDMIREWEEKTGYLVYHVIKDYTNFGLLYSLLYISDYQEEWEMEAMDIKSGSSMAFVLNSDYEDSSEFGFIGIEPMIGGIIRVA